MENTGSMTLEQMTKLAKLHNKDNFSLRELFDAFDADGDGIITMNDLKQISAGDGDSSSFSHKDLANIYAKVGRDLSLMLGDIADDEVISIDDLFKALDKNADGKIVLGDFLRIAKKDGNLMFISGKELEGELDSKWKK